MSDTVAVAAPMAPGRAGLRALAPLLRSSSGLVGLTLVVAVADAGRFVVRGHYTVRRPG